MEGKFVSLQEITNYFNFWRQAKKECISDSHARQLFATLKERYDDYNTIPLKEFSDCLSSHFIGQGVEYPLNSTQEKNILEKLANTTVKGKLKEEMFVAVIQYWTRESVAPARALIVVDIQNDFITGSLRLDQCPAEEDGAEVVPVVNQIIQDGSFDVLAYTFDCHPPDHCSFFSNVKNKPVDPSINVNELKLFDKVTFTKPIVMEQILWPDHCVQNEWGFELHQDLRKPDPSKDIVVHKGQSSDVDSYSAFWDNGNLAQTDLCLKLLRKGISEVYLCGLAFDFCVAYSAEDAAILGFNTYVFEDACRAVDLKSKEETKMKFAKLGIKLLQSSHFVNKSV